MSLLNYDTIIKNKSYLSNKILKGNIQSYKVLMIHENDLYILLEKLYKIKVSLNIKKCMHRFNKLYKRASIDFHKYDKKNNEIFTIVGDNTNYLYNTLYLIAVNIQLLFILKSPIINDISSHYILLIYQHKTNINNIILIHTNILKKENDINNYNNKNNNILSKYNLIYDNVTQIDKNTTNATIFTFTSMSILCKISDAQYIIISKLYNIHTLQQYFLYNCYYIGLNILNKVILQDK